MMVADNSLASLKDGERGRISAIGAVGNAVNRLLEMGLTEGTDVEVVSRAPLGDPIHIRLRGYHLSIRLHEARLVAVESL